MTRVNSAPQLPFAFAIFGSSFSQGLRPAIVTTLI